MSTTVMRNSKVGDNWIRDACAANPVQFVIDPATGQPTPNISTGPVRLSFINLDKPIAMQGQQANPNAKPKYGTTVLYTPFTDMQIFWNEYYRIAGQMFPEYWVPHTQQFAGLETPFRDQAVKFKFDGFTPGCWFANHTSQFKVQVYDVNRNPVVDPNRVYPGVWAICIVNAYGYGKAPPQPKKGVAFGLQAVMLIADDERIDGGGPIDPRMAFGGVNVKPPSVAPGALAGLAPPSAGGAPAGFPGAAPAMPNAPRMPAPATTGGLYPADDIRSVM